MFSHRARYSEFTGRKDSPRIRNHGENIMIKPAILAAALALSASFLPTQAMAQVDVNLVIGVPPPPPRYEAVPYPRAGYVWAPGYWAWDGHRHAWVGGNWLRERPGYAYAAPRWTERQGRWYHEQARWNRLSPRGDMDHDGVPNRYDRDRDGDGVPNRYDRHDGGGWDRGRGPGWDRPRERGWDGHRATGATTAGTTAAAATRTATVSRTATTATATATVCRTAATTGRTIRGAIERRRDAVSHFRVAFLHGGGAGSVRIFPFSGRRASPCAAPPRRHGRPI